MLIRAKRSYSPGLDRVRRPAALVWTAGVATSLVLTIAAPTRHAPHPLDEAAPSALGAAPNAVVFATPIRHPRHSSDGHRPGSGHDTGSDSESGDTSVSNTVDGREVGGARTYNNHTDGYDDEWN